ncbi:MAG: imidazolonepropionase [Thermoprotei archaeon]|nr:MAG: imidazolonepropionase [Thermoprotei archaeon]
MPAVYARTLYTGKPNEVLHDIYVVFEDKIINITKERPKCDILAEGIVTPAFIDAHCHIGMARSGEPSAEEETNEKMDSVNTLADAINAIYFDDRAFKESVEYGVLYSCVLPGSGNIIGGRGVIIRNFADNVEEAFIKYAGFKVALGFNPRRQLEWKGTRPSTRMGVMAILRRTLIKAKKEYALVQKGKKSIEEVDPNIEQLFPVIEGKEVLRVHVHKNDDILNLLKLKREFNLKIVIDHACDVNSEKVFQRIKEEGVPLVYGPVDAFPYKTELKNETWHNIRKLVRVKPLFGLMTDHPVVLQRNLFLQLRFFRRFGMSKSECISIITSANARILGINDTLGTIERGKLASIIVWNGDPFSLDSYPIMVIAEGKVVYKA